MCFFFCFVFFPIQKEFHRKLSHTAQLKSHIVARRLNDNISEASVLDIQGASIIFTKQFYVNDFMRGSPVKVILLTYDGPEGSQFSFRY